jgi:hypothetical protein
MKFFPTDWRADPALRSCGLAARGLWIEMLALMHEAEPRGYLLVRGKPPTPRQLANLVGGCTPDEVVALMAELDEAGVYSINREGVIFSRKMAKDADISQKRSENGAKGASVTHGQQNDFFDLPGQNVGPRSQKPEARSQKPENQTGSNPEIDEALHPFVQVQAAWAAMVEGVNQAAGRNVLANIYKLAEKRQAALRARIRDYGLEDCKRAIALIPERPFLLGDNDRGWVADFDWLLRPASIGAILEGQKYTSGGGRRSGWN